MLFLGIGLVMLLLKYMEIAPVVGWSWPIVLSPFAMAVLWWWWSDMTGYTKRKVIQKEDQRKQARIDKNKDAMGTRRKPPR
ncbi:MAG: TIGR04438 family Trp-rich protein [Ferruginibacter sp.]|nr:TIGR04438 family Trp-rich protein [Rhodoferax sp.]